MVMEKAGTSLVRYPVEKSVDQAGAIRISGYQEGFGIYDTYGINCRFYLTFYSSLYLCDLVAI
jgi:hypothetical protein